MRTLIALAAVLAFAAFHAPDPAAAQARAIDLHDGLGSQNRVGRLIWRGGVELDFADARFGGVSAMQIELGGRTAYMITDRGDLAEVTLEYDRGGRLAGAELANIRAVTGAGGRGTDAAIEAIARMPDGGWLVAFERNHRLMHFSRSREPLQTVPRLLTTPIGLERASSRRGIEAAASTIDRKVLLIGEDIPTTPGFTQAWLGDGAAWTPMTYAMFKPYRPVGATMLPGGDILVIERRGSVNRPAGTRFARINKRLLRPGAPIQTSEVARLEPPFVTANFEAVATSQGLQGQTVLYVASDNEFSSTTPTKLVMFELLP